MPGRIRNVVHIKNRTAGTSNELSFDVLEAKKHQADATVRSSQRRSYVYGGKSVDQEGRKWIFRKRKQASPGFSTMPKLYTNDAAAAARNIERARLPYQDPAAEIVRRKRNRTRRRFLSACMGVLVIGAIVVLLGTEISRYLADQERTLEQLNQSLETVEECDSTVIAMDELLSQSINDQDEEEIARIKSELPSTAVRLREAYEQAKWASGSLVRSNEREIANQEAKAVAARLEMISKGDALMNDGIAAKQAAADMHDAWQLILEADTLATEAGNLVTETTDQNVNESMEKSNQAIERFEEAKLLVEKVKQRYPEADVSGYSDYLDKRIEGQKAALESDASILLMDRASAEESYQILYEYDTEAAEIAEGFPQNPAQPVLDAYQQKSSELKGAYDQARSQAASADAYLRDYLGEPHK